MRSAILLGVALAVSGCAIGADPAEEATDAVAQATRKGKGNAAKASASARDIAASASASATAAAGPSEVYAGLASARGIAETLAAAVRSPMNPATQDRRFAALERVTRKTRSELTDVTMRALSGLDADAPFDDAVDIVEPLVEKWLADVRDVEDPVFEFVWTYNNKNKVLAPLWQRLNLELSRKPTAGAFPQRLREDLRQWFEFVQNAYDAIVLDVNTYGRRPGGEPPSYADVCAGGENHPDSVRTVPLVQRWLTEVLLPSSLPELLTPLSARIRYDVVAWRNGAKGIDVTILDTDDAGEPVLVTGSEYDRPHAVQIYTPSYGAYPGRDRVFGLQHVGLAKAPFTAGWQVIRSAGFFLLAGHERLHVATMSADTDQRRSLDRYANPDPGNEHTMESMRRTVASLRQHFGNIGWAEDDEQGIFIPAKSAAQFRERAHTILRTALTHWDPNARPDALFNLFGTVAQAIATLDEQHAAESAAAAKRKEKRQQSAKPALGEAPPHAYAAMAAAAAHADVGPREAPAATTTELPSTDATNSSDEDDDGAGEHEKWKRQQAAKLGPRGARAASSEEDREFQERTERVRELVAGAMAKAKLPARGMVKNRHVRKAIYALLDCADGLQLKWFRSGSHTTVHAATPGITPLTIVDRHGGDDVQPVAWAEEALTNAARLVVEATNATK